MPGTSSTGGSSAATGGSTDTGGGAGTAMPMDSGSGTGGQMFTKVYGFDANSDAGRQGWGITYTNAQAGSTAIPAADITISLNTTDGQPDVGSLQFDIPYSMPGQYVGIGVALTAPIDLTNKVLTARVKIVSGLESPADLMSLPPGAKIYVKSNPNYLYEAGVYTNLTALNVWTPISFDYQAPAYVDTSNPDAGAFDPADIREIGIQIDTGGMTTTATPAVVLIDTVAY
jgi:hypothetical protein